MTAQRQSASRPADDSEAETNRSSAPAEGCRCPLCTRDRISSGSHAARLRAFMERQKGDGA